MKNLHEIHQSPEEKLANSSGKTVIAIEENTAVLKDLLAATNSLASLFPALSEGAEKNLKKLEEIKSATLITNRELKKFNKSVCP